MTKFKFNLSDNINTYFLQNRNLRSCKEALITSLKSFMQDTGVKFNNTESENLYLELRNKSDLFQKTTPEILIILSFNLLYELAEKTNNQYKETLRLEAETNEASTPRSWSTTGFSLARR